MQEYYFLNKHITEFDLSLENYNPIGREQPIELSEIQQKYPSTQNYPCPESLKICVWDFFSSEDEVNNFMSICNSYEVKKFFESKLGEYPKGATRLILIELLYSIRKFVNKMQQFNAEQISTLYAIFLYTHEFFTSSIYISAETIYQYFKDFVMIHSINFFPECQDIFHNDLDVTRILEYFTKLYLRFLPLIRLLSKPNFTYNISYVIPPEIPLVNPKKGKKQKGKKDKSKKSKKSKK